MDPNLLTSGLLWWRSPCSSSPGGEEPRAGYGLTGMRERAELLGGELELGAAGGRRPVPRPPPVPAGASTIGPE